MAEEDYDWPGDGELVICDVKTVKNFGAFLELEEYDDKEGFIHISEISSGWVKRIKDHIREGEKRVCKVLNVNKEKGHIDLSLKKVNEHQRREKIQAWKNQQKAEKLLQIVADRLDWSLDKCYDEFAVEVSEEFESLYKAFEECTLDKHILKERGFKGNWIDSFVEVAKENISPPYVTIKGFLELTSPNPDGIEDIKYALSVFHDEDGSNVDVNYIAAPKYRVTIQSTDYKIAEGIFEDQAEEAVNRIEEKGGDGKFYREED